MPGSQELLQIIDLPSNERDISALIEALTPLESKIKEISGISIGAKSVSGVVEFKKNSAELAAALDQVAEMNQKLIKLEEQLAAARKKGGTKERSDEEIRASVAARAELKSRTDAIKAEDDAYKQLALTYNKTAAEAKRLQAVALKTGLKEDAEAANAATAAAKLLSDQLKAIDRGVGDNRRNVGNYVDAVKVLEEELANIRRKMDELAAAGQKDSKAYQDMARQAGLLETLTSQQAKGFGSVTMELRSLEKALQTMRAAGLEGSEAFEKLRLEVASAKEEFREFQEQQKILASDSPILASLTVAAKGLAGAYAVGAGTAALFADGNEKIEKELNKLVAIMTVLQGLQEAHELLQKKGAIAVAFRAAAEKIKNWVMTGSTTATKENTAAEVLNTEAEVVNTEVTEANTVAQEGQVVATEAVTAATEASTGAMVALRFALMATGIGAILLLLPLAAKAFSLFAKSAEEAAKEVLELQEMVEKLNETIAKQAELEIAYSQGQRKDLQDNLALTEKQGKNYYELFAIRKRLAEVDEQEAGYLLMRNSRQNDVRNAVRKTTEEIDNQRASLHALQTIQGTMEDAFVKGFGKMSDGEKKVAKEEIENHQKSVDIVQKSLETKIKLLEDYNSKVAAGETLTAELEKYTEDERRAVALASAQVKADAIIRANERIVNDERSTQAQILAAMDRSTQAQLSKIAAQKAAVSEKAANKEITPAEAAMQQEALEDARLAVIQKNNEAKRKLNAEYYQRFLSAQNDAMKAAIETESKAAEAISNNVKMTLDQRLAGYNEYAQKQALLINADANLQKQKAGQTAEELFAIEVKRQQRLQELFVAGQTKQTQIIISSLDNQQKTLENRAAIDGLKDDIKVLKELEEQFKSGKITIEGYQKAREALADKSARTSLQMNTVTLEFIRGERLRFGQDVQDIDKQIYANKKHLLEMELSDEEKVAARKKELKSQESELARATEDLITTFYESSIERQLNGIQSQIDKNNQLKETESSNIQQSTMSATEKAAALIVLDKKVADNNEALARKQRDLKIKEATFEKAKAVLDIGVAQGEAVAKTLLTASVLAANPATAAFAPQAYTMAAIEAGIGAAEIAAVLAKPIPKYEVGTDNHPGGLMKVHPGELRVDPDGKVSMTPDAPETLTYGAPGTKIIPANEVDQFILQGILNAPGMYLDHTGELKQELRELKQEIRRSSQDQVNALRKMKPANIHVHNDAAFLAHIQNSI